MLILCRPKYNKLGGWCVCVCVCGLISARFMQCCFLQYSPYYSCPETTCPASPFSTIGSWLSQQADYKKFSVLVLWGSIPVERRGGSRGEQNEKWS